MARQITASSLRQLVEIHLRRDVPVEGGGADSEMQLVAKVFGQLKPVAAVTFQGSVNIGARTTHRLYVAYREDLTVNHVVRYRGKVYRVVSSLQHGETFRASEVMLNLMGDSDDAGGVASTSGKVWQ